MYPAAATANRTAAAIRMAFFPPDAGSSDVAPSDAKAGASTCRASASSWVLVILAGAVAVPCPEGMLLVVERMLEAFETPAAGASLFDGGASAADLPVASAARCSAVAIGCAAGFEIGCHGYSFAGADGVVGAGIDSSRAASVGSGSGAGSASTSKTEALTALVGDGGCVGKGTEAGLGAEMWGADGLLAVA